MQKRVGKLFFINIIIILCAYTPMLFPHFSVDSYVIYESTDIPQTLASGRLVFSLFYLLCESLQFNPVKYQTILILSLIISSAFVLTMLVKIFYEKIFKEFNFLNLIIMDLAFLISFLNVFYLEWFLYPETTLIYSLSIVFMLFAIIASEKKNCNVLFSILWLFLSLNCYEATFAAFIMIAILGLLIETKFEISLYSIKQVLKILFIAATAAIMKFAELKIIASFGFSRTDFINTDIIEVLKLNILEIISFQKDLWLNALSFLPSNVCFLFGLILLIFIIKGFYKEKLKFIDIVYSISLFLGCYFSIFVLKIMNTSIWLAPRTITSFFFFISVISVTAVYFNKSLKEKKVISIILVIFLLVNYIQIQNISMNHFKLIAQDCYESQEIDNYIKNYEDKTGTEISKIAIRNDAYPTWTYPNVEYSKFDTNVRALVIEWVNVSCINYWANSSYEKIHYPNELYIDGCNWNELNLEEQITFIDDTAYLIIY